MLTLKVLNSKGLKDYFLDANERKSTGINNFNTLSNTGKISVLEKVAVQNITSEEIQEKFREESASITLTEEIPNANKISAYTSIKELVEEMSGRKYALRNLQNRLEETQKDTDEENLNDSPFSKILHFEDCSNSTLINCESDENENKEEDKNKSGDSNAGFAGISSLSLNPNDYRVELTGDNGECNLVKVVPEIDVYSDEMLKKAKREGKTWITRFLRFYKKKQDEEQQKFSEVVVAENAPNVVELMKNQEAKELKMLEQLNQMEKAMNSVIDKRVAKNAKSEDGNFIEIDGSLVYFDSIEANSCNGSKIGSWTDYVMNN